MTNKEALERIRATFPKEWRRIKRKVFRCVAQYHSADIVYIHLACSLAKARGYGDKHEALKTAAELQVRFDCPLFFVSQGLLDAAAKTELPESIDWASLRLPFPAGAFVLPVRSGCFDATGTFEVAALEWSVYQEEGGKTKLLLTTLSANSAGYSVWFDDDADHSKQFQHACLRVLFTILFAMAARPEYIERGHKMGTHKKSGSEIWRPNLIGRKYATRIDPNAETGTHASPRMHWRRGHFRYQPFGIGRTERKVIWIEPMLIAAKVMEASA
jgi:hypothetical protein